MTMLRITLKSLAARKMRLAMTATAIVLGVTFITGTLVLTETSTALFDRQFEQSVAGVDLIVRDAATADPSMGPAVKRRPVPESVAARIRDVPGVTEVEGVALGLAPLVVDGRLVETTELAIGSSWSGSGGGPFRLRQGGQPARRDEIAIDASTASSTGVSVGETVSVALEDGGTRPFRVVGIVEVGESDGIAGSTVALFAPEAAQSFFGLKSSWSELNVVGDGRPAYELALTVGDAIGDGFVVAASRDIAAARTQDARRNMQFLLVILSILGGTALIVGSFMIANTFAIVVAQRTREFGTLRAVGASVRQVRRVVVGEALFVGALASAVGVACGIAVASGMRSLARNLDVAVPDGQVAIPAGVLFTGALLGIGVTLVAAMVPARRAARVSPVAAMRTEDDEAPEVSRKRLRLGGLVMAGAGLILVGGSSTRSVVLVAVGSVFALAGVVLCAASGAAASARLAGRALDGRGMATRLARINLQRSARRTAATSAALAAGLAAVTFMTVIATSGRETVAADVNKVMRADLTIEPARGSVGGLPRRVYDAAVQTPGVEVASRTRHGHGRTPDGGMMSLTAVDPVSFPRVASLDFSSGDLRDLATGGVAITDRIARARNLEVGDELVATFEGGGPRKLPVVGVFDAKAVWLFGTDYLVSLDTFTRYLGEGHDAAVLVRVRDGVSPASVRRTLLATFSDLRALVISDQAARRAAETDAFDAILALVRGLLFLAMAVALLGIANSLGLSIVQRTREIGLLRATGMTRREVGLMVRTEAALTAMIGGAVGVALGFVLGAAMVRALGATKEITLTVPLAQLAVYLLAAIAGGVIAGVIPGRRARRMDVLSAISSS